jgi:hypothetical protein
MAAAVADPFLLRMLVMSIDVDAPNHMSDWQQRWLSSVAVAVAVAVDSSNIIRGDDR